MFLSPLTPWPLLYVKLCFSCGQYILANGSALELMLVSGVRGGIRNFSGRDPEPSELRTALAVLKLQIAVLCCCGGPFIMPWQQWRPLVHSPLGSPRHSLCPLPSQVSALPADTVVWSSLTSSHSFHSSCFYSCFPLGQNVLSSAHLIVSLVHASLLDAKNNTSLMLKSWKIEIKPTTQVTRSVAV